MRNAALWFNLCVIFFGLTGCESQQERDDKLLQEQRKLDAAIEASIDSAYAAIRANCTAKEKLTGLWADSLVKQFKGRKPGANDSLLKEKIPRVIRDSLETATPEYPPAFEKVTRVIAALKADCDTTLAKETYKQVLQLLRSKPPQQRSAKNRRG